MTNLLEDPFFNYTGFSTVSHEIWNGKPFFKRSEATEGKAQTMIKLPYYIRQAKWIDKFMEENDKPSAASAVMKASTDKDIDSIKKETVDATFIEKVRFRRHGKGLGRPDL